MSNSSVLLALSLFVQDASLKYATENNLSEAQNYMQLWRQNGEKMDVKSIFKNIFNDGTFSEAHGSNGQHQYYI
ncbi:TPA: hypothetical protein RGP47_004473 [Klebsiella pneumoniae]|nr:hypothetical protein [Klebsiella pneumoniae]